MGKCVPVWAFILGCGFILPSLYSIENPGSLVIGCPGFWFAVAPCWLLVGLATLSQDDEGYCHQDDTRCCCDGDHGERLVTGACEVLG